jgi:pimeloyl-ACP methyl ester carboxylesterase
MSAVTEMPQVRFARNGDVHLAYQVLGDGPHDLVLVWGGPNHLDLLWETSHTTRLLRRLAAFSRLIHFDQRGTGLSDRFPVSELPTLEQRADDIAAVMNAAASERAVILGESDGGLPAMLFAATYPEHTTSLALWGTLARGAPDVDYPWAPSPEVARAYLDAMEQNWGEPFGIELVCPSLAGDEQFRSWWGRNMRAAASPTAARAFTEMTMKTDVRAILPTIHVPALVMHRTGDMLYSVDGARYIAESIPDARFIEFPGEDHLFLADDDDVFAAFEEFVTGEPARPRSDRVLATALFVDIVESTDRAVELGDRAWRDLLESHQALFRRELDRFGGQEVDTAGDGLFAAFDGPGRAVSCACAIRDSTRTLGIEVRAGLHTGECELIGGKLGGLAVHIASRVAGRADAGEVLVSRTIKDLVAGSGIRMTDRGTHTLKGIPDSWELYSAEV